MQAGTAADRQRTKDPRKSIAERYHDRDDYMTRYKAAVDDLVTARWILREDRDSLLNRGAQEWNEATK